MWVRISEIVKRDITTGFQSWYLFIIAAVPLFFILLLLIGFPLLADYMLSSKGFDLYKYYSITGITIASLIPVIAGHFYTLLLARELKNIVPQDTGVKPYFQNLVIRIRMVTSFFLSIMFLLLFNFLTEPVPGEGWLRNCFVAFLFALQAPLVFIFLSCDGEKRFKGLTLSLLYLLFVIVVPVGLVTYHPWNYLAFFSPFYWIAWAWVISLPFESIVYGSISVIISLGYFTFLCHKKIRKPQGS